MTKPFHSDTISSVINPTKERNKMTDFNFDQASYGDLLAHAKQLDNALRMTQTALANRERQRMAVSKTVQELIENKVITDEEAIEVLVENLDIVISRLVHFTVTVEVTGSMEVPYGQEVSEDYFEVDEMTYDGNRVDVDYSSVESLHFDFDE